MKPRRSLQALEKEDGVLPFSSSVRHSFAISVPIARILSLSCRPFCFSIAVVEVAERFAYYGLAGNLIMYLTSHLGETMAVAAQNVNVWVGVSAIFPLVGAFVADSYLGRLRTIIISSLIYLMVRGLDIKKCPFLDALFLFSGCCFFSMTSWLSYKMELFVKVKSLKICFSSDRRTSEPNYFSIRVDCTVTSYRSCFNGLSG